MKKIRKIVAAEIKVFDDAVFRDLPVDRKRQVQETSINNIMLLIHQAELRGPDDTVEEWIETTVYKDDGVRREIHLDHDRDRLFFFADPLDFDKDDTMKPARYWLDECEGWLPGWHEVVKQNYLL